MGQSVGVEYDLGGMHVQATASSTAPGDLLATDGNCASIVQGPIMEHISESWNFGSQSQRPSVMEDPSQDRSLACRICRVSFETRAELVRHASSQFHSTLQCDISDCEFWYHRNPEYLSHLRYKHPDVYRCNECLKECGNEWALGIHRSQTGHALIVCAFSGCGKRFSRQDTYSRHRSTHDEASTRHPCKYCRKYRGSNGFKRRDHLLQHIRGYHNIQEKKTSTSTHQYLFDRCCPHKKCSGFRLPQNAWGYTTLKSSTEYAKHMREVHNESDFPCPRPGCDRVGAKGYFRKADLRTHLKKVHDITNAIIEDPDYC
ncbi:hypothetical protein P154DRAFT_491091 [Amniculicola lignicola CBS 123094]|uniref:C2H2-type domain-containing protein n=1 Tax=Amniculicola lignicola CBS 123094 TaxID=1392246 RepID=A0A6A5WP78_9PLEO|nr:hypothetical protein P154DRAFT_491091 [Amniculicola lignicola CBS 123094]